MRHVLVHGPVDATPMFEPVPVCLCCLQVGKKFESPLTAMKRVQVVCVWPLSLGQPRRLLWIRAIL